MKKLFALFILLSFVVSCSSQKSQTKVGDSKPSLTLGDDQEEELTLHDDKEEELTLDSDQEEELTLDDEPANEQDLGNDEDLAKLFEEEGLSEAPDSSGDSGLGDDELSLEQGNKVDELEEENIPKDSDEEDLAELFEKEELEGSQEDDQGDDFDSEDFAQEESKDDTKNQDDISEDVEPEISSQEDTDSDIEVPFEDEVEGSEFSSVQIKGIRFFAEKNKGTLVIDASQETSPKTSFNSETRQFVIEIENAIVNNKVTRPIITKEFRGPIEAVQAYQDQNNVRIVVQMKTAQQPIFQTEGSSFLVIPSEEGDLVELAEEGSLALEEDELVSQTTSQESTQKKSSVESQNKKARESILSATSLEDFLLGKVRFYGKPISIETKEDVDIRSVIEFISEEAGLNIIFSSAVTGKTQVKLKEVPWDQILITLLRNHKLGYVRQGSVIRIDSLDNLKNEAKNLQDILEAKKSLSPVVLRVLPVNFAKADQIAVHVKSFLTPKRGQVATDKETNSLIVTDTQEVVGRVKDLLEQLDQAPPQVMIEAKVVEASETFSNTMGINWTASGVSHTLSDNRGYKGQPITLSSFLSMNLAGDASNTLRLRLGTVDVLGSLSARLFIEEQKDNIKVIASPRILAMNKVKSQISHVGQVFSKKTTRAENGDTDTTYQARNFQLDMSVTPQVSADGSVIMELDIKREFPGAALPDSEGERPINTRSAKTQTLVKSGETAVIGGIYQDDEVYGEVGVPVLQNLPLLGWLFKSRTKTMIKTELLIFLKPNIVPYHKKGFQSAAL